MKSVRSKFLIFLVIVLPIICGVYALQMNEDINKNAFGAYRLIGGLIMGFFPGLIPLFVGAIRNKLQLGIQLAIFCFVFGVMQTEFLPPVISFLGTVSIISITSLHPEAVWRNAFLLIAGLTLIVGFLIPGGEMSPAPFLFFIYGIPIIIISLLIAYWMHRDNRLEAKKTKDSDK